MPWALASRWAEIAPILERDAADKRRLADAHSPADVVEQATNGGEYVPEAGVRRILLVPTNRGRPWVRLNRQRDALVLSRAPTSTPARSGTCSSGRWDGSGSGAVHPARLRW